MAVDYEELKKDRTADWREDLRKAKSAKERTKIERIKMPENPPLELYTNPKDITFQFKRRQDKIPGYRLLANWAASLRFRKGLLCQHRGVAVSLESHQPNDGTSFLSQREGRA